MNRSPEELVALVRQAFGAAQASGRPGHTMRSAVLKNRLLQLSDGTFKESDWDADSWPDLLYSVLLAGVIEPVSDGRETIVHLRDPVQLPEADQVVDMPVDIGPATSVRPDLWRAVMPGRGRGWWSPSRLEVLDAPGEDGRHLPEVSDDQMRAWRREFASARTLKGQVTPVGWVEDAKEVLERSVRAEWYAYLKRRIIEHLQSWFSEEGLTPPLDIVLSRTTAPTDSSTEIRRVVIDVVRQMTADELAALALPAAAVLRAMKNR